jgi:hypothetical protein
LRIWGWLGVALLVLGAALLVWRAATGTPPDLEGKPTTAAERIDRYEILGSLGLVLGAGVIGAAVRREDGPGEEPSPPDGP